ncbi:MAG: hypothetical protein GXP62_09070 [Oligoflexia bacterium]|nr:hypothetical protein [Oligoflexia bacterium]
MARWTLHGLLISLILAFGCTDNGGPVFGQTGNGGGSTTHDSGETGDAGVTTSDSGNPDGGTDGEGFDDPGDIVGFDEQGGEASVELSDLSGDSNQDQQFYMVLVDTADEDIGFQVRYDSTGSSGGTDTGGSTTSAMAPGGTSSKALAPPAGHTVLSPMRAGIRAGRADGSLGTASPPLLPPPPLDDSDIGVTVREFHVRSSLPDDTAYMTSSATLWAIGETVAIWVDAGVPIDWDIDCDGIVDVPAEYDAYGFDNCDLKTIADIVDFNIVPHLRSIFGEESDVNEDGLVSVLITPQLNVISYTSDDESVQGGLVGSYADPEVDLTDWNANTNPGSDEQELIYVFAPDPYGFFNPLSTATVDEYTSMELSAQIAQSFFNLISYNQHVLVGGGSPEETWFSRGLGALAADLTGFGAVFYADAWDYLDAPQLYPLVTTSDGSGLSTDSIGAQYLFARWLYDAFGESTMADLVQVGSSGSGTSGGTGGTTGTAGTDTVDPSIGTTHIESVTSQSFSDLAVKWQVALITSGVTSDDGTALVTSETYPSYAGANTLTAPTSSPSSGDYYGANGYQQGVDLRGTNRYMEGGTTDAPVENTSKRVKMNGTDFFSAVTGIANWGYVQGSYGAQVVRLTDITIDNAFLKVQASTSGFVGAVVRWADVDPLVPDTVVEQIFSVTKADNVDLPVLPTDGSSIYGVGEITEPGYTTVMMDDGTSEQGSVYDTDRWLLSLADHVTGESVDVAIHVTRHYSAGTSEAAPFDIWASVVPEEWIPTPTVEGTQRGSCAEGVDFQYPSSMLEYLYYQLFISSTDGVADFVPSDDTNPFSCGTVTNGTSCGEDWDRDGILDVDELTTTNYVDQVNAMLCTLNGNDASLFTRMTPDDLIDIDSLDDDDVSAFDRALDLGGMTDSSGEEALIRATLEGGKNYLVVVGAGTYTGPYELEIKQVE